MVRINIGKTQNKAIVRAGVDAGIFLVGNRNEDANNSGRKRCKLRNANASSGFGKTWKYKNTETANVANITKGNTTSARCKD